MEDDWPCLKEIPGSYRQFENEVPLTRIPALKSGKVSRSLQPRGLTRPISDPVSDAISRTAAIPVGHQRVTMPRYPGPDGTRIFVPSAVRFAHPGDPQHSVGVIVHYWTLPAPPAGPQKKSSFFLSRRQHGPGPTNSGIEAAGFLTRSVYPAAYSLHAD